MNYKELENAINLLNETKKNRCDDRRYCRL